MVTDEFGGYCGVPSDLVVTAVAVTNSTRLLANTTVGNNTTVVSNATWSASLYVQPSLTAGTVDNAVTQTSLLALTANVDKLTSAKYGSVALKSATMKEAAVAW